VAGSAFAANILPASGATVVGSSAYSSVQYGTLDPAIAGGNLINGTSNPTLVGGLTPDPDPRWLFADGSSADQYLIVDLNSPKTVNYFEITYNGGDRAPLNYQVLTSSDGSTFTPITGYGPLANGILGDYTAEYTTASPVTTQYVEFFFGPGSFGLPGNGGGAGQGAGIYQLDIELAPVPEPAAWALMLVGFAGLGAALRRRRGTVASA